MPSNELTPQELQQQQQFQEAANKLSVKELQQAILEMVKRYNSYYAEYVLTFPQLPVNTKLDQKTISLKSIRAAIEGIKNFKKQNTDFAPRDLPAILQKMAVYQSTLDKKKPSNGLMLRGAVLGTVAAGALSLAAGSPSALLGAITATSGQFGIAGLLVTGLIGATAVVPALPLVLIGGAIIGAVTIKVANIIGNALGIPEKAKACSDYIKSKFSKTETTMEHDSPLVKNSYKVMNEEASLLEPDESQVGTDLSVLVDSGVEQALESTSPDSHSSQAQGQQSIPGHKVESTDDATAGYATNHIPFSGARQ